MTWHIRSAFLPMILTTGVALGGCSSMAMASWHGDHRAKELAALNTAKTSARQAVGIAQTLTGGRAMRVAFDREDHRFLYRIKTLDPDGKVMWVRIDSATGKITDMHKEGVVDRLTDRENRLAFAKLPSSATNLEAAMAAASKDVGGKVLKAAFRNDDGRQVYTIRVAKNGQISRIWINPATGAVEGKKADDDVH